MTEPQACGDPGGDRDRRPAGAEYAVDPAGLRHALEGELVVQRQDRPPLRKPEAGSAGVPVDRDHVQAAGARGGEQPRLVRPEHEQPHANRLCDNPDVSSVLAERVAELKADRRHGASWMARRAVEGLAEVAAAPADSTDEVLERLVAAGRELATSRPGVGAVAGAVGRLLASASASTQLAVEDLQRLVGEEADALIGGRRRAAASIAIQLRERLEDAVVLTHSASATVREALLRTPPERVICTVSSPQDEGRAFSEDLREQGLEVELVEDEQAPSRLEWASILLLGADTVFRDGTLINKAGTTILAEAACADNVPVVVASEVVKLAPIDAADAPELTAPEFELTPPELIECVVTEEGTVSPEEV